VFVFRAGPFSYHALREMANRQDFQELCTRVRLAAGDKPGEYGEIPISFRLPDSSTIRGRFREGAPLMALVAFVLKTEWAEKAQPPQVRLLIGFPPSPLDLEGTVTKELNRATIGVKAHIDPPTASSSPPTDHSVAMESSTQQDVDAPPMSVPALTPAENLWIDVGHTPMILNYMNLANVDRSTAVQALRSNNWDYEVAATRFIESTSSPAPQRFAAASAPGQRDEGLTYRPIESAHLVARTDNRSGRTIDSIGYTNLKQVGIGCLVGSGLGCCLVGVLAVFAVM